MPLALQILALLIQMEPMVAKLFKPLTDEELANLESQEQVAYDELLAAIKKAKGE
jgi:hypothetical protein